MATVSTEHLRRDHPGSSQPTGGSPFIWLAVPLGLCLLGTLCLAIDLPAARYFESKALPRFVREVLDISETFGHAAGVGLILLAIVVVDPSRRTWLGACLIGSLCGGLAADAIKLLVSRTRPRNIADLDAATVWSTFGPWLPLINTAQGDSQSFPSAHTAMATGFAVVLSAMSPRGRWLFFTYAALTGLHRMECSAHFPSDVCFGAAVGWLVGHAALALREAVRFPPRRIDVTPSASGSITNP